MTYGSSATQLESVLLIGQALNDMSKNIDAIMEDNPEGNRLGDGHVLVLENPIRIISDSQANFGGEPEVFGWVYEDEHGWDFTQEKPKTRKEGIIA